MQDKLIIDELENYLKSKISSLDAVCFVANSNCSRLTINQKYVFNRIFDLFGKDMGENFIPMLTFCDGNKPPILSALEEKNFIFAEIKKSLTNPWYLKFNNSFFISGRNELNKKYWDLGNNSFKLFFKKLKNLIPKNLQSTINVLKQRKILESHIKLIQENQIILLNKMEIIRQKINIIKNQKEMISNSGNFKINEKYPTTKKIDLIPGIHTTLCLKCNRTCHDNCTIADDSLKIKCSMMDTKGNCINCNCNWTVHKNVPYIIKVEMIEKVTTLEDLKKQHYNSESMISIENQIIEGLKNEYKKTFQENVEVIEKLCKSINELKNISLSNNNYKCYIDYLDMIIQSERYDKKEGFIERINSLSNLKEFYLVLENVNKNLNNPVPSVDFL